MNSNEITASFARCLIENTRSFEYDEGFLIDLPFSYLDGDAIRLYVENHENGFRITDRGDAILSLDEIGVNTQSGRPLEYINAIIESSGIDRVGAESYEISELSDSSNLGCMIAKVAEVAIQIDTLRLHVKTESSGRFVDVVSSRIRDAFDESATVKLNAPMPQTGGKNRSRRVTASVSRRGHTAYVHAISYKKPDGPVSKAFRAFSRSAADKRFRFSALEGIETEWNADDLGDLESVSEVSFDGHPGNELLNRIDLALSPSLV